MENANNERIFQDLEYVYKYLITSGSDENIEIIAWLEKTLINYGYPVHRQKFDVYRQSLKSKIEAETCSDYRNPNPYNKKEVYHQTVNIIAMKNARIKH